jgi:peptide/nickel transport system ATP-binding protein
MTAAVLSVAPAPRVDASEPLALETRDLTKEFRVGRKWYSNGQPLRAVDSVSLSLRRGDVLAIVGESGCGKTTLSRLMLGLQQPSAGEIFVGGEPLTNVNRKVFARRVQPVFQDPYSSLNPRKTIGEIIRDPLQIHKIGTNAEQIAEVEAIMERVGLARRLIHSYPSQLSGGQRQRVAIARALVIKPEIIICDEPTSALDVSVQAQILNLLQSLREQMNLTYLFISHDLSVVEYMADYVAVMYLGRIVEAGPAAEVLRAPRHPYTRALLSSILTAEPGLGLPDLNLGRGFPDPLNPPNGCRFHPRCIEALDKCAIVPPRRLVNGSELIECHLHDTAAAD